MKLRAVSAALVAATFAAGAAQAHVRMIYPPPRYPAPVGPDEGLQLKDSPCGVAGDSRTTDPSRITVLEPGQTITVQFRETINHPGFYRISFDDDGQDAFVSPDSTDDIQQTPMLPVLADNIADITPANGEYVYEQAITLPSVECERCTLQVIQVMTTASTWTEEEIYFQCADLALRAPSGGGGTNGSSGNGGSGGVATAGGSGGVAGMPGTAGTSASGGWSGAGTAGSGGLVQGGSAGGGSKPHAPSEEPGGCSMQGRRARPFAASLLLATMALAAVRRRGRRRASQLDALV